MKIKIKLFLGFFFFIFVFAVFAYFFINQNRLLNQYRLSNAQQYTVKTDTLKIVSSVGVTSLNPLSADIETRKRLYGNIYEGLVQFDKNNNLKPALALSWGNLDDLTWEYKLRRGVKFHDGSDFTAQNVLDSYNASIQSEKSGLKTIFQSIAKIEIIDDFRIRIKTKQPDPLLNNKLNFLLIHKAQNVGTGPYIFSKQTEKEVVLSLFKDYWGEKGSYAKVVFQVIPSRSQRLEAFGSGDAYILTSVPASSYTLFKKYLKAVPSLEVTFLLFNQNKELWQNYDVRNLVANTINRETISDSLGKYSTPVNQFISPGVFGYAMDLKDRTYDAQKVRQEVERIFGQEGRKTELDLTSDYQKIANYLKNEFKKINLRVDLKFVTPQELETRIEKKEPDMYIIGWRSETGDAGDVLNTIFALDSKYNSTMREGDEMAKKINAMILESNHELNPKKRLSLLQKIMRILVDEVVVGVPLFEGQQIYAVSDKIVFSPRIDGMIVLNEIKPSS